MLGGLRLMSTVLPGSVGMFSLLQEAFQHEDPNRPQLNVSKALHDFLDDFWWLTNYAAICPARIAEYVLDIAPLTIGACDAAGTGMGGIRFAPAPNGSITPLLWRQCFPPWIQHQLVPISNPNGTINNSKLELASLVAYNKILAMTA